MEFWGWAHVGAGIAYLAGAFGGGDKKPQQPVAPKPEPIKVEPLHPDGGDLDFAAGGGNIVAAGAGNIVAAGAGNIVAAGAGNIVAAGAGNVVAAGAGNIVAAGAGNIVAAGAGNLVKNAESLIPSGEDNFVSTNGSTLENAEEITKEDGPGAFPDKGRLGMRTTGSGWHTATASPVGWVEAYSR